MKPDSVQADFVQVYGISALGNQAKIRMEIPGTPGIHRPSPRRRSRSIAQAGVTAAQCITIIDVFPWSYLRGTEVQHARA
jgi:hypothetical protein